MANKLLKAALWYGRRGLSVIPIRPKGKIPSVKWEPYQTEQATSEQIRQWWRKWPSANIGIVCGKISGITVVDADSQAGREALEEFLPDTLAMPMVRTENGWHYYFKYVPGIPNKVRAIRDCDVRNDGGYVIAPPSINENGRAYKWMDGLILMA